MDTIEEHSSGLVDLLQVCQRHNLNPVTQDKDPPHAKVASDIMSCLFMVSKLKGKTTYFVIEIFFCPRKVKMEGHCCTLRFPHTLFNHKPSHSTTYLINYNTLIYKFSTTCSFNNIFEIK